MPYIVASQQGRVVLQEKSYPAETPLHQRVQSAYTAQTAVRESRKNQPRALCQSLALTGAGTQQQPPGLATQVRGHCRHYKVALRPEMLMLSLFAMRARNWVNRSSTFSGVLSSP